MKIRVTVTLDVNPEAWAANFGTGTAAETRADVQEYATNLLTEHFQDRGVLA